MMISSSRIACSRLVRHSHPVRTIASLASTTRLGYRDQRIKLQLDLLVRRPFATTAENPSSEANTADTTAAEATAAEATAATEANADTAAVDASPTSEPEKLEFQAETRQLLDIVINSIYTDKEVFLRELISNASDALEKLRHFQASGQTVYNPELPLEIRIELDEVTSTITITDTGIGMDRDEMISNLGTIARSGSKKFIQQIQRIESGEAGLDPSRGIIGKFGVGFYSAFMIADKVEFRSRLALKEDAAPKVWISDGAGTYQIVDLPEEVRQDRGSSVVIHVRDTYWHFVDENLIEKILMKYSNFVNFPIYLNGKLVNTLDAIWAKDPKSVTSDEYTAFYRYIANAVDEPFDSYHFRADAPIDIKALFFIPSFHSEKFGMGRMEPGVSLYSRKVLIESKSPDILPDWMRFVKGVVDSEDLPLAISREKTQDTALIKKLRRTLTRKFVAHLSNMARKENARYMGEFYHEYAFFLKEGICQDYEFQEPLAKLLYFETNKNLESDMISLDEYISRMRPEQKDIYYLVAPTRDAAIHSPYLEAFDKAGVEVLLMFTALDDFLMGNLDTYEGRKLVSVEKGNIDLSELVKHGEKKNEEGNKDTLYAANRELSSGECLELCSWFKSELGVEKVASCTISSRLSSSPAIVTDNESGAMRRVMRYIDTTDGSREVAPIGKQHIEINPKHPIIVGIYDLRSEEPMLARVLAEQVFDNCLIAAGLLDDGRPMLPRLNDLMICLVNGAKALHSEQSGRADPNSNGPESTLSDFRADDLHSDYKNVEESTEAKPKTNGSAPTGSD